MRPLMRFPAGLLLCAALLPAVAAQSSERIPPARIEADYDVFKDDIHVATISETYTRTQNRYRIESVSRAVGLLALFKPETIRVTSEGTLTAKGLRPDTFATQRKLDSDRNASADFDWPGGRITLDDRAGKRTLPLPAGTQDRLSAMYQFMFLTLKNASALDFYMTNGNKVDIYNYLVSPGQSVTVPLGTFSTLYVASTPKKGESRTEIWLAQEHAYLPCKMVITDPDGGRFTQVLTRFDAQP